MAVMRMGYMHVKVTDLAEAKEHYSNTVGLYQTLEEDGKVYYKGWDEWDHHSVVLEEGGVGVVKYGFKVEYSEDIDIIEKKARDFGLTVERMSKGENPGAMAGMIKLAYAGRQQKILGLGMELRGLDAIAPLPGDSFTPDLQYDYIYSVVMRIAGGADEVLRNQIAERVLGMPGDVRMDKDVPFDQLK